MMERKGSVFADHYHSHLLRSPTELVNAIRYVLGNAAHHFGHRGVDAYSSTAPEGRAVVAQARSWLLTVGWRRARFKPGVMARTIAMLVASLAAGCAASRPAARPEAVTTCRCRPDQPCWPAQADWQRFGATLHGKLEQPRSPLAPYAAGEACAAAIRNAKNPFYLQDQAGGTQSTGWLGAWTAAQSA